MDWSSPIPRWGTDAPPTPEDVPLQAQGLVEGWRIASNTVRSIAPWLPDLTDDAKAWTTDHPERSERVDQQSGPVTSSSTSKARLA